MAIRIQLSGRSTGHICFAAGVWATLTGCSEKLGQIEQTSAELTDPACLTMAPDILLPDPLNACAASETQPIENYGHAAQQCPGKLIADVNNVASTPLTPYVQWLPGALPGTAPYQTDCAGVQLNLDAHGWNGTQWILRETILVRGSYSYPNCNPVLTYSGPVVTGGVPAAITGYSKLRIVANGIINPGVTPRNSIPIRVGFKANPGTPPNLTCMQQGTNCALPNGSCIRAFGSDAVRPLPRFDIGSPSGGADGKGDVALLGADPYRIPIAFSNGDGKFTALTTYGAVGSFATLAGAAGAKAIAGDFDGNGSMDIAVTNPPGLTQVRVAFSGGNGSFPTITAYVVTSFPSWANTAGVKAVAGDYNGDGKTDIALTGGAGWASIPVAFSTGNGAFTVTNTTETAFSTYATQGGKVVAGDFNGDGKSDLALVGGSFGGVPWSYIPVAFSNGDGSFRTSNSPSPTPSTSAAAVPVEGDFDGDGFSDIAVVGLPGSTSIFVAYSLGNRDGQFSVTQTTVPLCPGFASTAGAKPVSGDFNNDGRDDIAWVGVAWSSVPIAYAQATRGVFSCPALVTDSSAAAFLQLSTQAGVKPLRLVAGY